MVQTYSPYGFLPTCWDMVKKDLLKVFQEQFSVEKFEKGLNATFDALIPKKIGALDLVNGLKDYRLINLVNGV